MKHYVLDDKHNAVEVDLMTWARFFENFDNLGGPPLLFETMVFGGPDDQWMDRYTTWEQAEEGHAFVVSVLSGGLRLSEVDS